MNNSIKPAYLLALVGALAIGLIVFINLQDVSREYASDLSPTTQLAAISGTGSGLVAHYTFDDGTANDASGNGNNGTLVGGPTATAGKIGGALSFDGSDDKVTVSHTSTLNGNGSEISLSAWINPSSTSGSHHPIVGKITGTNGYLFEFSNSSNKINVDTSSFYPTSNSTVGIGIWTHVVVIGDSTSHKIYINGQLDKTDPNPWPIIDNTTELEIGAEHIVTQYFQGIIDDVRIYNRARSAGEVGELYALGSGGPTIVNGSCGSAAKTYTATESFPSGSYCASGTASPVSPTNPTAGGSSEWSCLGDGGTNASCTATRQSAGDISCTSFTYSSWGSCVGGTQTRSVQSSSPSVCTGASPVTSQSCTPSTDTTPPSVPTNLTATAVSSSQINLSWTASTDASGIGGYKIYRGGSLLTTTTGTATTYSNTSLSANTTYSYTVAAYDTVTPSNTSAQSGSASATTLTGLPPSGELIPAERKIDWSRNAGLTFTIPSYSMGRNAKTDDGAVGNGTADDTTAITNCIRNTPANTYCYLPAGTYRIANTIYFPSGAQFKALKGAGPGQTTIMADASVGEIISASTQYGMGNSVNVTNGATKGSTRIYIDSENADFSKYKIGDLIMIDQPNGQIDEFTPSYMNRTVGQTNVVTYKGGNYLDLNTPLYYDYNSGIIVSSFWTGAVKQVGIEDLKMDRVQSSGGLHNIYLRGCINCWVKNVKSLNSRNWHVFLESTYGSVVRDSWFEQTWQLSCGGNACYGVTPFKKTTDSLVENNVFIHMRHSLVTEYGGQGNIFGYNYSRDPINQGGLSTDFLMGDALAHGGTPMFTLWEGNIFARLSLDNVLGGSRYLTAFRNHIETKGIPTVHTSFRSVTAMRNNIYENIIGNILGTSGRSMVCYEEGAPPCWDPVPYTFGIDGDGDESLQNGGSVDQRPKQTMIRHGNYDYYNNSFMWEPSISTRNIPASLYLSSQPSWWPSGYAWPVFGPDPNNSTSLLSRSLPAKVCHDRGSMPNCLVSGPVITCTSFTYSNWGTCSNNQQMRTVLTSSPSGCTGGSPVTSQSCTPSTDTTPPSTPTNLIATAVSSSQINLSWTASTDASGIGGYKIYRGGTLLTTTTGTATTYSNTSLSANTTYSYTVAAYDTVTPSNTSAQSSSASTRTQAIISPTLTPPNLSAGTPSTALSAGTTQSPIAVTTNETATCKYSTTANTSYASMTGIFTTTGGTEHSTMIPGLRNGQSYVYYIRCSDTQSNVNTADYTISF